MEYLRTPDERFDNLSDFDFAPHYQLIADGEGGQLRMHYLDEGPEDGAVVLLLHGQPSWCYLYRYMIDPLVDAGFRVLAPDLIGFGRSDKPTKIDDYTYARHVDWLTQWLQALDLTNITLFCQDWGGLIGLRVVAAETDRFSHVVVSNTGLPTGDIIPLEMQDMVKEAYDTLPVVTVDELEERFRDKDGVPGFLYWRKFCAEAPDLDIGKILGVTTGAGQSAAATEAYRAPFPDDRYKAGARKFPSLVPIFSDQEGAQDNRDAWKVLKRFEKPFMTAFADDDPVTAGGDVVFQKQVPGAKGVAHRTIKDAGHFLQQEQPADCVQAILDITGRG